MDVQYEFIFDEAAGRVQISYRLDGENDGRAGAVFGRCGDLKQVEAAERDFSG
jgi:hypothetical protein